MQRVALLGEKTGQAIGTNQNHKSLNIMPALSFSVFKERIISGEKRQTIRKPRKNPIASGDVIYLYWQQRQGGGLLGTAACIHVTPIAIYPDKVKTPNTEITTPELLHNFAVKDGFQNWKELITFFESHYGLLPFKGDLIERGDLDR